MERESPEGAQGAELLDASGQERARWADRLWPELDPARIVYEDDDVLVVDKPAGVPSQAPDPSVANDLPSRIRRFLAARRGLPLHEVYLGTHQRLDQDTSGLILYTLRPSANPSIARQFEQRSVQKHYLAAVSGRLPAQRTLVHWLAPAGQGRMRVVGARSSDKAAREARSEIVSVREHAGRQLVGLRIDTGRTHQIRVQLAELGLPVVGDLLYGGVPAPRIFLHAQRLSFRSPHDDRLIELEAPPPVELEDWLEYGLRPAYRAPLLLRSALALARERRFVLGRELAEGTTTAFRLLHEAADGAPGFGVDVYDRHFIVRVRDEVTPEDEAALLAGLAELGALGAYLKRHPKQANELGQTDEQVAPTTPAFGEPARAELVVYERGVPFGVCLNEGLRTGLFLDQRDNRRRVAELGRGRRVLNLFAYTGSFSVAALAEGAAFVTTVDTSRAALAWAERNVARIGCSQRHEVLARDAFDALDSFHKKGERFDLVIVDPPSYSTSKRGRFRVTKDYVALCRAVLRVLAPDGAVLACLNHYGVSQAALRRFVRDAADAEGVTLDSLKDLPTQVDYPAGPASELPTKSVLVRTSAAEARKITRTSQRTRG